MSPSSHTAQPSQSAHISFERERGVYALEVVQDVMHAVIEVGADDSRTGRIQRVFTLLAGAGVPVFLIKMHSSAVTLAFAGADRENALKALAADGLSSNIRGGLALIVVRAASMRDLHGVMVHIADALFAAGARLYETGDSHNSVQCLIEAEHISAAEVEICRAFHLPQEAVLRLTAEGGAG
jgi:aspartokinase